MGVWANIYIGVYIFKLFFFVWKEKKNLIECIWAKIYMGVWANIYIYIGVYIFKPFFFFFCEVS